MEIKNLEINKIEPWGENKLSNGGVDIHWSANIGFGCLRLVIGKDNKITGYTERMCSNDDKRLISLLFVELIDLINVVE